MRGYLLDTNVVSELRKGKRSNPNVFTWHEAIHEEMLFTSVLVLGEIRCGIERIRTPDPAQAKALERWLLELELVFEDHILPVTSAVADRWGRMKAITPLPVIDGLMAATALENDLTLVTRNVQDVTRTRVKVFNPFDTKKAWLNSSFTRIGSDSTARVLTVRDLMPSARSKPSAEIVSANNGHGTT